MGINEECKPRQVLCMAEGTRLARWVWRYNHTQLHLGLGGRPPIDALRAFPEYDQIKQV